MVDRGPAALVGLLEHRGVDDPAERPGRLVDQLGPLRDLDAGGAEQLLRLTPLVRGGEEDRVARLRADRVGQPGQVRLGQVLGDRATRRAGLRVEHHVGQAAGAAGLRPVLPAVQLLAGLRGAARHDHGADVATGVDRAGEHPELGAAQVVGELDQLHPVPQVGLVGTVAVHRVGPGDPRDRQLHLVVGELAPELGDDLLAERDDVVLRDERHLDVELGELRLAVGAEVLVAVAAGDLVVPLHARHHQQLLEQLRGLRQRIPGAGLQADRDQEVARALRRRPGQGRRLDLVEVVRVQHLTGDLVRPAAQAQRLRRAGAAQVEVAVLQADVVGRGDRVVDRQRQRRGLGEHGQLAGDDLDRAGGQLRVLVAVRAGADLADDLHAELVAQRVRVLLAEDHLHHAGAVPQVDEDDTAVVAPAGHPACQRHRRAGVGGTQTAGVVGPDHGNVS